MLLRHLLARGLFCSLSLSVHAEDAAANLPLLALNPPVTPASPSRWSGFYAGSEVFAISGSGKGLKGGIGGAADFGYNHAFSNNVVVGADAAVGYAPSFFRYSPYPGFDIATANIKAGFDMGRLMPYVTAGILLEKPHTGLAAGYRGASDAVNGLLTGSSNLKATGTAGAGANYALTDRLTVGVNVSVSKASGGFGPGASFGPGIFGR